MKKIAIIGGGIIGLSAALYLSKHDYSITLLEKNTCGKEASYEAAGMLAAQSEFDYYEPLMDICIKSREMYADYVSLIEKESRIDVELQRSGMIRPALTQEQEQHLKNNRDWQEHHQFEIEFLEGKELRKLEPSLSENIRSGLLSKNDGQVNNRKLMEALVVAAKKNNIEIKEQCEVLGHNSKDNNISSLQTTKGNIHADIILNAAGSWASTIFPELFPDFPIKPVLGQMVMVQAKNKILDKVIFGSVLGKGGYIVPRKDNSMILGSTLEEIGFTKRTTEAGIKEIISKCADIVPEIINLPVVETWAGFRPTAPDLLPVISKTEIENLIVATGHYRNGILLAPLTAQAVEELIVHDRTLPEIKDFGLERFKK